MTRHTATDIMRASRCPKPMIVRWAEGDAVACGCPQETPLEAAEKAVEKARSASLRCRCGRINVDDDDALIRAVRHHDAERIRALNPQPDGWNEVLVEYIADLIDPEVED